MDDIPRRGKEIMSKEYLDHLVNKHGDKVYARYNAPKGLDTVYIGRGSVFGNPFKTGESKTLQDRMDNCMRFRRYLTAKINIDPRFREEVKNLLGQTLVCFCSNGTRSLDDGARYCHGHILVAATTYLNSVDGG